MDIGYKIALFFVPFLFALCFHEFAHGWVAKLRGDNTAEALGRLTLNPMAHIDWLGTVILPIAAIVFSSPISFGWAKPVPVSIRNLKNPRVDMFWIALAGPMSNIFLACVAAVLLGLTLRFFGSIESLRAIIELVKHFILINLFLAVFNILPLNPLDGGKIIARFLPASWNYTLERNQHITGYILMFLILTGSLRILSWPVFFLHQELMEMALRIAI